MKLKLITLALAAAIAAAAGPAFADDAARQKAQQVIKLKDGSTLYVFKDGKMAREDKFGRAFRFKAGETLVTADGRKMTPVGDEVGRLDGMLREGHQN